MSATSTLLAMLWLSAAPDAGVECQLSPVPRAMLQPGATLPVRPSRAVLRFHLVVQGELISVFSASARDTLEPAAKATPGSGYWLEPRNAADKPLASRWFHDPSILLSTRPDGGITRTSIAPCVGQVVDVDFPNDPAARAVVVLDARRRELARFGLPPRSE